MSAMPVFWGDSIPTDPTASKISCMRIPLSSCSVSAAADSRLASRFRLRVCSLLKSCSLRVSREVESSLFELNLCKLQVTLGRSIDIEEAVAGKSTFLGIPNNSVKVLIAKHRLQEVDGGTDLRDPRM